MVAVEVADVVCDDVADVDWVVAVVVAVVVNDEVCVALSVVVAVELMLVVAEVVAVVVAVVRSQKNSPASCSVMAAFNASISFLHNVGDGQNTYGKKLSHCTFDSVTTGRSFQPFVDHAVIAVFKRGMTVHLESAVVDFKKNTPSTSLQTTVLAFPPQVLMRESSFCTSAHVCPMSHDSSSVSSLQYNLPVAVFADINNSTTKGRN